MKINLGSYAKFITAAIGQVITFLSLYYHGEHWVSVVIAVAAALGVYAVPNTKPAETPAEQPHLMP
jgi:hypothetical protein